LITIPDQMSCDDNDHVLQALPKENCEMTSLKTAPAIEPLPQVDEPITDFRSYFAKSNKVIRDLPFAMIERVASVLYLAYEEGRSVFLFGNGGSASLASHFACDLAKGTALPDKLSKRFRALSLTDNVALMTAWANDTAYQQVFAEQLRNFIQAGDVAFGISGSGCSPNVLLGLQAAREAGALTVGLGGFKGGKLPGVCDLCIIIPSDNMQIIEDFQLAIAHALFTVTRHRIRAATVTITDEAKRSAAMAPAI
jgi:D-sedoheptulose 7-phosphate isomerase